MGNARSTTTSERNESVGVVGQMSGSTARNGNRNGNETGSGSPPRGVGCSFDLGGESSDSSCEGYGDRSCLFSGGEGVGEFQEITSFDNGVGLMFDLFDEESDDDSDYDDDDYKEWEEARNSALEDLKSLKQHARYHLHPEDKVVTNGNCGRCYFLRGSVQVEWSSEILGVVDVETVAEMCARDEALEELKELKVRAEWHLHPGKCKKVEGGLERSKGFPLLGRTTLF